MVIGLDVGGTKICGIAYDGGKIKREKVLATPKTLPGLKAALVELAGYLGRNLKVKGLGIGVPGLLDPAALVWQTSPNIKYVKNFNLKAFFAAKGYSVLRADNDANCFTRAEMEFGQGAGRRNFLTVTLGTGVGGGMVINGQIYRGQNYCGGEFGKIILDREQTWERLYQKAKAAGDYKAMSAQLGLGLAALVNILDPECVVLGGSVGQNLAGRLLPGAKRMMKKHLLNKKNKLEILVSKIKNPGAVGAALMLK